MFLLTRVSVIYTQTKRLTTRLGFIMIETYVVNSFGYVQ